MSMSKINSKTRVSAVKDYMNSKDSLRNVSSRHGISAETLRRFVMEHKEKIAKEAKTVKPVTPAMKKNPPKKVFAKKTTPVATPIATPVATSISRKTRTYSPSELTPNANKRWKADEDDMLRDAVLDNFTVKETCNLLGRTAPSIFARKCYLIEIGYIGDKRFTLEKGIKRTRNKMAEPEIVSVVSDTIPTVDVVEAPVEVVNPAVSMDATNIRDLAMVVRDYGVKVTLTVTSEGTEVKLHN
jgi:transposase-like protein